MRLQVTVDARRCVGSMGCVNLAPDSFELGPEGHARPRRSDFGEADLERLREAEDSCPMAAITVEVLE